MSLSHRIQILLHIAVQHQLRVGIGIVVDQVIQLPAVEPGLHELPLHGEGIDGNQRAVRAARFHAGSVQVVYLREKLSKKLGVSLPLDKAGAKKLRALRQELTEQNESLRPKLGQIREELDQLSKLRYWTRKAIPEALPERDDFSEQMEVRENRRELEQVMDAAIDAVTQEADEQQPVQDASKQKHDQERL